ncbi:MAG: hypothetical protein HS115_01230 [Spirochaetales bacterium]|nr:hypothetical protein [Spirochaetales bacterium]
MNREIKLKRAARGKLAAFESSLNVLRPEDGPFSPKIIGYGEISTVFTFSDPDLKGYAYKRMAVFRTDIEINKYTKNYLKYNSELIRRGFSLPDYGLVNVQSGNQSVLYLVQQVLPSESIVHRLLHRVPDPDLATIFEQILIGIHTTLKKNTHSIALGIDGQLSNWASAVSPGNSGIKRQKHSAATQLAYLDTSLPLMKIGNVEQTDPELFLRICPALFRSLIRLFFLEDVMTRYYDFRKVTMDIIANLYKEKRADLIPHFILQANTFFQAHAPLIQPLNPAEIRAYYRQDALIWKVFLFSRRLEQKIQLHLLKRKYPMILPPPFKR